MDLKKPAEVFDRETEWASLTRFVEDTSKGLHIGVVYGRRRQGKSYLLRYLSEQVGGFYYMAAEEESRLALDRLSATIAEFENKTLTYSFQDWTSALRFLVDELAPPLIVIDEFPNILSHSTEVPSVIQMLYDERRMGQAKKSRLILCGSALSIMSDLLGGAKPLRGRARLNLLIRPFDYRESARYWNIKNHEIAFRSNAIVGGTPGYRDFASIASPQTPEELDTWVQETVLDPTNPFFNEIDHLLDTYPRLTEIGIYRSILWAIAHGASKPSQIASRLARPVTSINYPLGTLQKLGFIKKEDDLLHQRRPNYVLTDPLVKFYEVVMDPRIAMLERHRQEQAWAAAQPGFSQKILGPHFEELARIWTRDFASPAQWGEHIGQVGSTTLNDPTGKAQHQVDIIGLAADQADESRSRVLVLGEAKSSNKPRSAADLERLQHIRSLFVARGIDAANAKLAIFGRSGFNTELTQSAKHDHDILLVDLDRLYEGE